MKSQMELALTIGTVVVGAVLLIAALVLSWEMLLPTTDACRIAAGIGYDVGALQSVIFTLPGDVNVHYIPPSICEFYSQMGLSKSGLVCQPLQGGNPNISTITVDYKKIPSYGISFSGPAYLMTSITFSWIDTVEHKQKSTTIKMKGIATNSPGLQGSGNLIGVPKIAYIPISKVQSPYGDVINEPSGTEEDAIVRLVRNMFASVYNGKNYSAGEFAMPKNWFLVYNYTYYHLQQLCEYRIIINSYLYNLNGYNAYLSLCGVPKGKFNQKFGFTSITAICDGKNSLVYYPGAPQLCLINKNGKVCNPWDQSYVKKYGTGFLKVRCFNLYKLNENPNISEIKIDKNNWQSIDNDFVYSFYRNPYSDSVYKFNATYDPDTKTITLKLWKP